MMHSPPLNIFFLSDYLRWINITSTPKERVVHSLHGDALSRPIRGDHTDHNTTAIGKCSETNRDGLHLSSMKSTKGIAYFAYRDKTKFIRIDGESMGGLCNPPCGMRNPQPSNELE